MSGIRRCCSITKRSILGATIVLLLGCAGAPVSPQNTDAKCPNGIPSACRSSTIVLDESIRTVAVSASPAWIEFILNDPVPAGKPVVVRAGSAVLGATKGFFSCIIQIGGSAGPIGLALGLIISPVCAIAGGIDGARDQIPGKLGRDASEVFGQSLEGNAIHGWLRDEVLEAARARNSSTLQIVALPEAVSDAHAAHATLKASVRRVTIRGPEADAAMHLVVEAEASLLREPNKEQIAFIRVSHSGEKHPMSQWLANDAALLKEGLRIASQALGEGIYEQISAGRHKPVH